ncbi:unnamed protein product [Adineta steineri]|uniref:Calcineurin-like phosphoesterase domain-containing protein n=1 Tax=Adineta steineri TaxID=433720 RepID=A0A815E1I2_9BILA|nr:unnamed protein product [Adineta steineri]CAF3519423.1 unnamed protein product [Adineta steineri]
MIRKRCLRPQQTFDSIEYQRDNSKISLLLIFPSSSSSSSSTKSFPYSYPTLITFPSNATLKDIKTQKQFQSLIASHLLLSIRNEENNVHFELNGKILDENLEFNSVVSSEQLILVINNIKLKFRQSKNVQLKSEMIEEFRARLVDRLPTENGYRPKTSRHLMYPNESLDLLFDTLDGQLIYLTTYLQSHFGERHEFTTYEIQKQTQIDGKQWQEWETGIYRMHGDHIGTVNIALASDWGAGTLEAALVASAMVNGLDLSMGQEQATSDLPHYTIHLGDIYYVGLPTEVQHCCLGIKPKWAEQGVRWPIGQNGSFTIPGNHELYSRGFGYWDYFLPTVGLFNPQDLTKPIQSQKTSYWVLENDQWRIIGLDSGYDSYSLLSIDNSAIKFPSKLMDWLKNVVGLNPQMTDKRGLIFFTHHQVVSAWNEKPNTDFPSQIASLLPEGRTVLYLWGHEHRLSFYEKQTIIPSTISNKTLTFYGRCIGNSGFPTLAKELPVKARETKLLCYDDRLYHIHDNLFLPDVPLGYNGYATMAFVCPNKIDDTSLYMSYKTLSLKKDGQLTHENPTTLVNEQWSVDSNGNVVLIKLESVSEELTQAIHTDTNQNGLTLDHQSCCCTTL